MCDVSDATLRAVLRQTGVYTEAELDRKVAQLKALDRKQREDRIALAMQAEPAENFAVLANPAALTRLAVR